MYSADSTQANLSFVDHEEYAVPMRQHELDYAHQEDICPARQIEIIKGESAICTMRGGDGFSRTLSKVLTPHPMVALQSPNPSSHPITYPRVETSQLIASRFGAFHLVAWHSTISRFVYDDPDSCARPPRAPKESGA